MLKIQFAWVARALTFPALHDHVITENLVLKWITERQQPWEEILLIYHMECKVSPVRVFK